MCTYSMGRRYNLLAWMLISISGALCADYPDDPNNGQVHQSPAGFEVWDGNDRQWIAIEVFWRNFATGRDSKYWGRASEYPPYREVRERDTLLIELEQGICLMEFWHTRWRRAQDVRRWDPAFNSYGGCPYVFD